KWSATSTPHRGPPVSINPGRRKSGLARRRPRVAVIGALDYAFRPNARPPPSPEERPMIAHRAAIASLAIACATDTGCRDPGIAPMRTEPSGPAATGGITESFDAGLVLADGRIDGDDRTGAPGGHRIRRGAIPVETGGMHIDDPIRLGPHCVSV